MLRTLTSANPLPIKCVLFVLYKISVVVLAHLMYCIVPALRELIRRAAALFPQ